MQNITNSDWRVLPEFPDYAITPDGQIWSHKRNKFLKLYPDTNGYLRVNLYNDLGRSSLLVHRLVGMAFIPLPPEFNNNYSIATINHKDHNKANNHYTNLEWVTQSYNAQEAWDSGYCDYKKKECFLIDSLDNTYTPFDCYVNIDKYLNLPIDTVGQAIRITNGLVRGRYIVGAINDPRWKGVPTNPTIEQIVESYADQIEHYKWQMGPKKITNLQTGESRVYNTLSEFAREKGLDPKHAGRYLETHSDLYSVELA